MAEKITPETTLDKIVAIKGAEEILRKYGLPCLTCPLAAVEMKFLRLGEVCKIYGMDINKLLEELNKEKGAGKNEKIPT